jgi:hypothetical protein
MYGPTLETDRLRHPALALAASLSVLALTPGVAAARGPSTPAERRRAVETTRKLEQQPLAKGSDAARRWLLQWIVEVPDIHVQGCSGPLDALAQDTEGERHGRLLYVQSMFGMAAFQVEHPREKDWVAIQTAGIESVLKAYRALLRAAPAARWEELDVLNAASKAGKLEQVVEQTMEGCGEERAPGPGEAI